MTNAKHTISLETTSFIEAALRTRIHMLRENNTERGPMFMLILAKHEIAELTKILDLLARGAKLDITPNPRGEE